MTSVHVSHIMKLTPNNGLLLEKFYAIQRPAPPPFIPLISLLFSSLCLFVILVQLCFFLSPFPSLC